MADFGTLDLELNDDLLALLPDPAVPNGRCSASPDVEGSNNQLDSQSMPTEGDPGVEYTTSPKKTDLTAPSTSMPTRAWRPRSTPSHFLPFPSASDDNTSPKPMNKGTNFRRLREVKLPAATDTSGARLTRDYGDKGVHEAKAADMNFRSSGKQQNKGGARKKANRAQRMGKKRGGKMQSVKAKSGAGGAGRKKD